MIRNCVVALIIVTASVASLPEAAALDDEVDNGTHILGETVDGTTPDEPSPDCANGPWVLIESFSAGGSYINFYTNGDKKVIASFSLTGSTITVGANGYNMVAAARDNEDWEWKGFSVEANTDPCAYVGHFWGDRIQFGFVGSAWGVSGSETHSCSWEIYGEYSAEVEAKVSLTDTGTGTTHTYTVGGSYGCTDSGTTEFDSEVLVYNHATSWYDLVNYGDTPERCVTDHQPDVDDVVEACRKALMYIPSPLWCVKNLATCVGVSVPTLPCTDPRRDCYDTSGIIGATVSEPPCSWHFSGCPLDHDLFQLSIEDLFDEDQFDWWDDDSNDEVVDPQNWLY